MQRLRNVPAWLWWLLLLAAGVGWYAVMRAQ
jgi:hypothetical protein